MKSRVNLQGLSANPASVWQVEGPYAGTPDCVYLKAATNQSGYKVGQRWGFIEDPEVPWDSVFRLHPIPGTPGYATVEIVSSPSTITTEGAKNMVGIVYDGVVVKTTNVAAGEGLTSSVPKSEIVLEVTPFIAKDDVTAQAMMLAECAKSGLELDNPAVVLEVKVRKFA